MAKIIYGVALSVITPLLRHYHNIIISLIVWIFLIIILIKLLKRFSVGFTRDFRNTYFKNSLKGCFSNTAQKTKFSIKNFFGKSDQVIFNEKILNGKHDFLWSATWTWYTLFTCFKLKNNDFKEFSFIQKKRNPGKNVQRHFIWIKHLQFEPCIGYYVYL